jgi:hypothetical protein
MMEHEWAVFLVQVLIKPQSRRGAPQKISELCLAPLERFAPHVVPVQLDQIERPHKHAGAAVADALK